MARLEPSFVLESATLFKLGLHFKQISGNILLTQSCFCVQINIMAARTVASMMKTSLGPKGMDKMIVR